MAHSSQVIFSQLMEMRCSEVNLNHFKQKYKEEIDSKRSFEKINSLKDLLLILKKRDCLSSLEYILRLLNNGTFQIHQRHEAPVIQCNFDQANDEPVLPDVPTDPVERIDGMIIEEIGQKWKNLARALKIAEGRIDELDRHYTRAEDIVREVLLFHRRNSTATHWKFELCNALDKARRKDLRLRVQEILARHGM